MVKAKDSGSDAPRHEQPGERAISLQYKSTEELPTVTASGIGEVARRIVEIATEHGIPIQENKDLAELLARVKVGQSISPESYQLVAQVISFLYHADQKWSEEHAFLDPLLKPAIEEPQPAPKQIDKNSGG